MKAMASQEKMRYLLSTEIGTTAFRHPLQVSSGAVIRGYDRLAERFRRFCIELNICGWSDLPEELMARL